MSKQAIYDGAAAEAFVAQRLLENQLPVFIKMVDCDIDLVSRWPECKHLFSLQVKLAHTTPKGRHSFHAGVYTDVDLYAIVYDGVANLGYYEIAWIPTWIVEANSHASLTQDMKLGYTNVIPPQATCQGCEAEEHNNWMTP